MLLYLCFSGSITGPIMPLAWVLPCMNWATPLTWPTQPQASWLGALTISTKCSLSNAYGAAAVAVWNDSGTHPAAAAATSPARRR